MKLEEIFKANTKLTENGDLAYESTGNVLLDILFMTEFFSKNINKVPSLAKTDRNRLFARFIRDPRFGLGKRDLGRRLMEITDCNISEIIKSGRFDDLYYTGFPFESIADYLKMEIQRGNELAKKWMPRYSSKDLMLAREFAKYYGMNKQQYGKFIKANTVENTMSRKRFQDIEFDKVPSLASIKYVKAFQRHEPERYAKFLEDVKSGKKDLKVATTTVYDIYKNRKSIDPDVFFSKIEKIKGNWIPIVDTSGSMWDYNDSIGKALSIGHYLAKCSSYCPDKVLSFSSRPQLITLGIPALNRDFWGSSRDFENTTTGSRYIDEINSMYTGDCSNTDFGAVMNILSRLEKDVPEYLIVLSDMEFDCGSSMSKEATMNMFKEKGYNTKIIWWNFNARHTTAPETDSYGNIFLSGYNPMLLKYLESGFNGTQFLDKLLDEYAKKIEE